MLLSIEVEIPDDMRLLSLQSKHDGTWVAHVKAAEPFYINSPSGNASGPSAAEAILAAVPKCREAMESYAAEQLRSAERIGSSNGSTRHGPQKLSDMF